MRSSFATLSTDRCEYPDRIKVALMCSTKSRRRLILISGTSCSSVVWMVIVERSTWFRMHSRRNERARSSDLRWVPFPRLLQRLTIKWKLYGRAAEPLHRCRRRRRRSHRREYRPGCLTRIPHSVAATRWMVRLELEPDRADRPSSPWLLSDELLEFLELRRLRQSWVRRSERVEDGP